MKLLMIRHGEPCYANVRDLNLVPYLAELTPRGIAQAEAVAKDERLKDADIIVASPFTRALQTAAIISRETKIPLTVEPAFHEILLDVGHRCSNIPFYAKESYKEFVRNKGVRNKDCLYRWESLEHIVNRAYPAMMKYLEYDKVIVVAHSVLIRAFGYNDADLKNCDIFEREFDVNSKFEDFVAWEPSSKSKK